MTSTRTNDDIMVTPSTKPTYGLGHKSLYCLPLLVNIMEQVLCLLFQLLTLILRNTRTPSPLPQYTLTTAPVHPHHCPSTPSPLPQYTLTTAPVHPHHCPSTPSPLPQYTLTTAPVHPHHCPSTPSPLSQYTLTTVPVHPHHCSSTPSPQTHVCMGFQYWM